jgi:hypothetical protein
MAASFDPFREEIAGEYNTTFAHEKIHRHHDEHGFKFNRVDESGRNFFQVIIEKNFQFKT